MIGSAIKPIHLSVDVEDRRIPSWAEKPLQYGGERLEILARATVAHEMMDAAFISVIEKRRPEPKQWQDWIDRQYRALTRTLPTVAVPLAGRFDLGDMTLAYLEFRVGSLGWRELRADLAEWLDVVTNHPSMVASKP